MSDEVGRLVWFDLMTKDVEAAKKFYGELLGWTTQLMPMPGGDYTMLHNGTAPFGGIVPFEQGPSHWLTYITVDDVDIAVIVVGKLGGKTSVPPTDIPKVGRFAVVSDPQGAIFAPFTSSTAAAPESDLPPPLGAICWSELHTTDPAAAASFYADFVGWTSVSKDMGPMGTYTILRRDQRDVAGMMQISPQTPHPPTWLHYVRVQGIDSYPARIAALGGKVLVAPMDIPGIGRFTVAVDNQGAQFALFT